MKCWRQSAVFWHSVAAFELLLFVLTMWRGDWLWALVAAYGCAGAIVLGERAAKR